MPVKGHIPVMDHLSWQMKKSNVPNSQATAVTGNIETGFNQSLVTLVSFVGYI